MQDPQEHTFLKAVEKHEMRVIKDEGVYRHLMFRSPKDNNCWFEILTWPNVLCINGDMGTYIFSRLIDMFDFFNDKPGNAQKEGELYVNLPYWQEKLKAPYNVTEFSSELFNGCVLDDFDEWVEKNQPESDAPQDDIIKFNEMKNTLHSELQAMMELHYGESEYESIEAAREFLCLDVPSFNMGDTWEWHYQEYKYDFVWCCYAIAWSIKQYNKAKKQNNGNPMQSTEQP